MVQDHPLKAFRKRQSPPLSQKQLAELLDVKRVTVARWETRARPVGMDSLPKITEATGISPAELRPDLAVLFKEDVGQ